MGFIYQIKNDINDKIYIGKTTRTVQKRFQEHLKRINERNNHLYLAMRKYGKEHFYPVELEECPNEQLNEREIYWIKKLNTYENGYNETLGGEGMALIDYEKQIAPYLNQNLSIRDISKLTGISTTTVGLYINTILNKETIKQRGNFACGKKNSKIIEQYDLDGNFIQEYPSLKSIPNVCHRNITRVLSKQQKSAGGFLWKAKDDPTPIEKLVFANKNKHKNKLNNR